MVALVKDEHAFIEDQMWRSKQLEALNLARGSKAAIARHQLGGSRLMAVSLLPNIHMLHATTHKFSKECRQSLQYNYIPMEKIIMAHSTARTGHTIF